MLRLLFLTLLLACVRGGCAEQDAVQEPVIEAPTLHSLGVRWSLSSGKAGVQVEWRRRGNADWQRAQPLSRVEDGSLFAGSVVNLEPDTHYDLRLSYVDANGEPRSRELPTKTRREPKAPAEPTTKYVVPGSGGGTGTPDDPFRGLAAAQGTAAAGDLFLVRAGVYTGEFTVSKSGAEGRPIIWRGAGDGETILEGSAPGEKRGSRVIGANNATDVWFERLTIRHAEYGLVGHEAAGIVVRRCHFHDVEYGIAATRNERGTLARWFIADNVIEGPSTWPRSKGIESARGIQLSGEGHDVCYNRIRGFADAIDTFRSGTCAAIDFHHNDISEMTDDGIELDYAQRNVRCFENRLTNVYQGISLQPVLGGPVYVFRNVLYNVIAAPFKLHNSPSGVHLLHNTVVKSGAPFVVGAAEPVRHTRSRNNLFIGTKAAYACEMMPPMEACDFDRDGFGGGPWEQFLKWNGTRFPTIADVRAKAPAYRHAVIVNAATAFASGALPPDEPGKIHAAPDLRLKPGSDAIDAGEALPGFNDAFAGAAPDLGAYEIGQPLPHYGPRPEPKL